MSNNLSVLLFYSCSILCLIAACTNLEPEVFSELTDDNFLQTEEEILSVIAPAYTTLYGYMGNTSLWAAQEISSDEMVIPMRGPDWQDEGHWVRLHQQTWTADDPVINDTWDFLYEGVSVCNRLIFQLTQLDRPSLTTYIGELRALRAIYYLWLLDLYGNIPIVINLDEESIFSRTANRKFVYGFIESELLLTSNFVSSSVDDTTYGRVNQMTILAALANLYLNAEVYNGTAEWTKAIAACDAIIHSGHYAMEIDYFSNFNVNNANSSEFIFAIPYDTEFAKGLNIAMQTLNPLHQQTYDLAAPPLNGWCTIEAFYNAYEEEDLRKGTPNTEVGPSFFRGNFLVGPQWDISGRIRLRDTTTLVSGIDPDGELLTLRAMINELFPAAWREAGARIGKYEIEIGGQSNMNNDLPIFRYTDILLMKAEALWRIDPNSSEALELVNKVRARAGVEPFTKLTAENLLAERGRELFAESKRRTDLIRFDMFTKAWWEKPVQEPCKILFPIPQHQLEVSPNLIQNPCY